MSTDLHAEIDAKEKTNPNPGPARPTPGERDGRLGIIAQWLVEGKPREAALYEIERSWRVSRRTAQAYLHDAQAMLAVDAAAQEELFYLRLSQRQRDRLLETVLGYAQGLTLVEPELLRKLTLVVAAACRLLDGRNRTAGQIHRLLREGAVGRASNPPGEEGQRGSPPHEPQEMLRADDGESATPLGVSSETSEKPGSDACAHCATDAARDEKGLRGINQQLDELRDPATPDVDDLFGSTEASIEELRTLRAQDPDDLRLEPAMREVLANARRRARRRSSQSIADNERLRRDLSCASAQVHEPEAGVTPKTRPSKELCPDRWTGAAAT